MAHERTVIMLVATASLVLSFQPFAKCKISSTAVVTECGQTLHVIDSDTARIEYKVGQSIRWHEICPWIIRFDGAASIRFELESSGLNEGPEITVATLYTSSVYPRRATMQSHTLVDIGEPITLKGSIAVVTLAVIGNSPGTGFVLNVTKVGQSSWPTAPSSVDRIMAGRSGEWQHPADGGFYSNNELSAYIVAPPNYRSSITGCGVTQLQYTEREIEPGCFDVVDVWSFSRYNGWSYMRMICGGEGNATFPCLEDLALLTFTTYDWANGTGFSAQFQRPYGLANLKNLNL